MEAKAYRNFPRDPHAISEVPLKEYRELAKRVELQCLHAKKLFGESSSPDQEIDKLTEDWSINERERFRYWFRNSRDSGTITTAENKMQVREAQYAPWQTDENMQEFKKKRKSIVNRLRRLQNEIGALYSENNGVVWTDENYSSADKKFSAISTALNQICVLLQTLKTREVAAAAITRTVGALKVIDKKIADKFVGALNEFGGMERVAAQGPVYQVARALKEELNDLHYGKHLRRFFHIYEALHRLGLSGVASDLEDIIQKDLSNLSGITKKLGEVYGELLKIPGEELTEQSEKGSEVKPIGEEDFATPEIKRTNIPAQ